MTGFLPIGPESTILSRTARADQAIVPIPGHPMFLAVDEQSELGGYTWRVVREIQGWGMGRAAGGPQTVKIEFKGDTPDLQLRPEDEIELLTLDLRAPKP